MTAALTSDRDAHPRGRPDDRGPRHGADPGRRPLRIGQPGFHGLVHAEPGPGRVLHRHPGRGRLPPGRVPDGRSPRSSSATSSGRSSSALLATMGPRTGMAQMPLARLAYGKSIVVPGLLNWLSCIGWDGINSVFGAAAISILTGLPFIVSLLIIVVCQGVLGILGYEAIHTFEKYMAIVLGAMFVVLTIAIAGQAGTGMARTDAMTGLDQVGAFILYSTIVASFVLAWALYASDYTRYLPGRRAALEDLLVDRPRPDPVGRLDRDPRPAGRRQGDGRRGRTRSTTSWAAACSAALAMIAIAIGTVAVNAMNDYTGSLSLLAAGLRIKRVYSAIAVAVLGYAFTIYLNSGDLQASSRATCCSSATGSRRGRPSSWPTGGCAADAPTPGAWSTTRGCPQAGLRSPRWSSDSSCRCRSRRRRSARRSPSRPGCRSTRGRRRSTMRISRTRRGSSARLLIYWVGVKSGRPGRRRAGPSRPRPDRFPAAHGGLASGGPSRGRPAGPAARGRPAPGRAFRHGRQPRRRWPPTCRRSPSRGRSAARARPPARHGR